MSFKTWLLVAAYLPLHSVFHSANADDSAVPLPNNVQAVWDIDQAFREQTATRERVCINGLWRWQPASAEPNTTPLVNWGYFKVPGCWPGITDYMQKDCQEVIAHPIWKDQRLSNLTAAWYEREITVPADWKGRRISLAVKNLNSFAVAFVDGKPAGEYTISGR